MKLQVIKTKNILPKEDLNKKKREKRYKRREEEKRGEEVLGWCTLRSPC